MAAGSRGGGQRSCLEGEGGCVVVGFVVSSALIFCGVFCI